MNTTDYLTVSELSDDQMLELKQNYLCQHLDEVEDRSPSYGELADADEIVPTELIYDAYSGTLFVPDDFFCSCCA